LSAITRGFVPAEQLVGRKINIYSKAFRQERMVGVIPVEFGHNYSPGFVKLIFKLADHPPFGTISQSQ